MLAEMSLSQSGGAKPASLLRTLSKTQSHETQLPEVDLDGMWDKNFGPQLKEVPWEHFHKSFYQFHSLPPTDQRWRFLHAILLPNAWHHNQDAMYPFLVKEAMVTRRIWSLVQQLFGRTNPIDAFFDRLRSVLKEPWFFGYISRHAAEHALRGAHNDVDADPDVLPFLVRIRTQHGAVFQYLRLATDGNKIRECDVNVSEEGVYSVDDPDAKIENVDSLAKMVSQLSQVRNGKSVQPISMFRSFSLLFSPPRTYAWQLATQGGQNDLPAHLISECYAWACGFSGNIIECMDIYARAVYLLLASPVVVSHATKELMLTCFVLAVMMAKERMILVNRLIPRSAWGSVVEPVAQVAKNFHAVQACTQRAATITVANCLAAELHRIPSTSPLKTIIVHASGFVLAELLRKDPSSLFDEPYEKARAVVAAALMLVAQLRPDDGPMLPSRTTNERVNVRSAEQVLSCAFGTTNAEYICRVVLARKQQAAA